MGSVGKDVMIERFTLEETGHTPCVDMLDDGEVA
jgi:hypothetical protein